MTMRLNDVPLSVYNRALELYGQPSESTIAEAKSALESAEQRSDAPRYLVTGEARVASHLTPFAVALAEYLSLSGPWNEESGEHAGESGYIVSV